MRTGDAVLVNPFTYWGSRGHSGSRLTHGRRHYPSSRGPTIADTRNK